MTAWLAGLGLSAGLALTSMAAASEAGHHGQQHDSRAVQAQPYAGQQNQAIASFSDQEIADLRQGRGMGLARPAELNGYPGPLHVLELAGELELDDEQRRAVEAVFSRMKQSAQTAGARYLEAERDVDAAFRSGDTTPEQISALVRQADNARAEVRLSHLKAHLETAPLLTAEQRRHYNVLRGYADPEGGLHSHPRGNGEQAR